MPCVSVLKKRADDVAVKSLMRRSLAWLIGLLLLTAHAKQPSKKKKRRKTSGTLARGVSLALPDVGPDESLPLAVRLPAASSTSVGAVVSNPSELMPHVAHAWDAVVAPHQAGLTDARETQLEAAPLHPAEAWHHYTAGQSGVVDSARLLIAFNVVPALQLATGRLHAAAARGDVAGLRALLDGGSVVDIDEIAPSCGSTALHLAAAVGSADAVRLLLDAGAFAAAVSRAGVTPLMVAASMGHQDAAVELIAGGADPNHPHAFGHSTALHFAAEMGRAALIRAMCANGADANARKTTGGTPLHSAADAHQPAAIRALVSAPCNSSTSALLNGDTTALYLAVQRGFVNASAALLDAGADVNFAMPRGGYSTEMRLSGSTSEPMGAGGFYAARNTERANGATALHAAVENGHLEVTRLLLARGARQLASMEGVPPLLLTLQYHHPHIATVLARADPKPDLDAREPQTGASALFVAAGEGEGAVVATLLELGATVDLPNKAGATALSHAAMRGHADTVDALLTAGASPHLGPTGSGGVLHTLLRGQNQLGGRKLAAVVKRLLRAGARASEADNGGVTALMLAASRGESAACASLIAGGADASAATPQPSGMTALMRAAANGHLRTVRVLLGEGHADPNTRAGSRLMGAPSLYLAAQGQHVDTMRALLEAGGRVDAELDEMRSTPLFVAAERGCLACVRLLLGPPYHADSRRTNWNGVGALHMAAIRGHVAVLDALTSDERAGGGSSVEAHVNNPSTDGSTALLSVAASDAERDEALPSARRITTLRWLLAAGADRHAARTDGSTPLLAAVAAGHADAVTVLMEGEEGARAASATLPDGRSALMIATARGDVPSARALLRAGAQHGHAAALEIAIGRREHELIALLSPAAGA